MTMKIIILAAGKGTRIMPLTRNTPKPLLDLGDGKTLLEEQIDRIRKSRVINEIILVIGYLAEQIEAKIRIYQKNGLKVSTLYNPFYDQSNNLISLWFAKYYMTDQDFMITNGDNLFTPDVFNALAKKNKNGIFLTISKKDKYVDDDMKVVLSKGKVVRVSKLISSKKADAESVGLALVSGVKYRKLFRENLKELVRDERYLDKYWLEVFNKIHKRGIPIHTFNIDGEKKWQEVDFHLDLKAARKFIGIN